MTDMSIAARVCPPLLPRLCLTSLSAHLVRPDDWTVAQKKEGPDPVQRSLHSIVRYAHWILSTPASYPRHQMKLWFLQSVHKSMSTSNSRLPLGDIVRKLWKVCACIISAKLLIHLQYQARIASRLLHATGIELLFLDEQRQLAVENRFVFHNIGASSSPLSFVADRRKQCPIMNKAMFKQNLAVHNSGTVFARLFPKLSPSAQCSLLDSQVYSCSQEPAAWSSLHMTME